MADRYAWLDKYQSFGAPSYRYTEASTYQSDYIRKPVLNVLMDTRNITPYVPPFVPSTSRPPYVSFFKEPTLITFLCHFFLFS